MLAPRRFGGASALYANCESVQGQSIRSVQGSIHMGAALLEGPHAAAGMSLLAYRDSWTRCRSRAT